MSTENRNSHKYLILGAIFLIGLFIYGNSYGSASASSSSLNNKPCTMSQQHGSSGHWGMPGGFSAPHDPTSEELSLLKKTFSQATAKCSHLPKDVDKLKVCGVSKQVVAGMNYAYTLEDGNGRTFKLIVFVPLPHEQKPEHVTLCEMMSSPSEVKAT